MNQKDVKKRELLEFKDFIKVSSDPWNPKNYTKEKKDGFHKIKLERPYKYIGYSDPVFKHTSKIDYPGKGAVESGVTQETGTTE